MADCMELAMGHIDMMFHVYCLKGFPIGLDSVAQGMGLQGKPPGMHGALAPSLWAEGEKQKVLDYVAQDVRTTLEIMHAVEINRRLTWVARSGRYQRLPMPGGWQTVRQALDLPEPDTSWMSNPLPRERFTSWLYD